MKNERFPEPVTLYLRHKDGQIRPTPLTSTEEAYKALMHSHDLALTNPNWQIALDAVVHALLDPTPAKVEASRRALEQLTNYTPSPIIQRRTLH
jgi:hypothetical protein